MTLGGEELMSQGAKQDPARQKAFKLRLESIFKTKSLVEWEKIFSENDACVEPVLKFSEACRHEQIRERGMVVSVPYADGSTVDQIGVSSGRGRNDTLSPWSHFFGHLYSPVRSI